ncbi:Conserved_hypothetical protein [Hexamita inflata]|uniref:Uncharacterized protein n=1 Tax=Hexamita inflata TaxID=28002 RepID=A0AA86TPD9_9EUKA|nr:Conserved hypothetical protein [Hexamita inflata]
MDLDMQSLIELPQQIRTSTISTRVRAPMCHSLSVLQRHYKLNQLKIVLILKTISHAEYIVAQSEKQFFVTTNGSFWSPLPVLSVADLELLKTDFGLFSTQPFSGDSGVVLVKHLTELHRLSQLVYFLSYRALSPKNALAQQQRFQGMDVCKAESLENYEFPPTVEHASDPYLDFYYNSKQDKNEFELVLDPFKQLVTIQFKLLPQFVSYMYVKTRVYGWVYADQHFSPLNGLFQTDFVLFNGHTENKFWTQKLKEIDAEMQGEDAADQLILTQRRNKKEALENKKAQLRKQIKEYKDMVAQKEKEERERLEREEKEKEERERAEQEKAEKGGDEEKVE